MDNQIWYRHKLRNLLQSFALLGAMGALLLALGWTLAGGTGIWLAGALWLLLVGLTPRLSPALILGLYRARPIAPREAPQLYQILAELARRAGLGGVPRLHYVPSPVLNAFAVGSRAQPHIGLTDGLLRQMDQRELAGVLAHEISHVRNGDLWLMSLADVLNRLSHGFALAGQLLLLVSLPLWLIDRQELPWVAILLLLAAPSSSALLQLALSRVREFDADLGAAELTGDPRGLASALDKMDLAQRGWLARLLLPGRGEPQPSLLRSHPPTAERVARLLALAGARRSAPGWLAEPPAAAPWLQAAMRPRRSRPGWHASGLWF